jgi:hypothetical protein
LRFGEHWRNREYQQQKCRSGQVDPQNPVSTDLASQIWSELTVVGIRLAVTGKKEWAGTVPRTKGSSRVSLTAQQWRRKGEKMMLVPLGREALCLCGMQSSSGKTLNHRGDAMSFGLYAIGFTLLIAGLAYAAHLLHIPAHWIAVGVIILAGVGILSGVKATRQRDSAK